MFALLGSRSLAISSQDDKRKRAEALDKLLELRETETIGQVLDYLKDARCPPLPEAVRETELELSRASAEELSEDRRLMEISTLRAVPYREIVQLAQYLNEHTPFSTKHGVKGAEFENVLVVFGRGWNQYNWNQFLEWNREGVPADKAAAYARNRNLFYVACSRPKQRLAVLFTQELSASALETLSDWFGRAAVKSIVWHTS